MSKILEINPLSSDDTKKLFANYTILLEKNLQEYKEDIKDDVNIKLLLRKYKEVKEDINNDNWVNSMFVGNYFALLDIMSMYQHPSTAIYNQLIYTYLTDEYQSRLLCLPLEQQRLISETISSFDLNPYNYKTFTEFLLDLDFIEELDSEFKTFRDKHNFCIDVIDTTSTMGYTSPNHIKRKAFEMLRDKDLNSESFLNVGKIFEVPIFTVSSIYKNLFSNMNTINNFFVLFKDEDFEDLSAILKIGELHPEHQQDFFKYVQDIDTKDDNIIMKIKQIIIKAKFMVETYYNGKSYHE